MNEVLPEEMTSAYRTPKSLNRQVAGVFAMMLIERTLPALIRYWGIEHKKRTPDIYGESQESDTADDYYDDDSSDDDKEEDFERNKEQEIMIVRPETKEKVEREEELPTSEAPRLQIRQATTVEGAAESEFIPHEALEQYEPPIPCEATVSEESRQYFEAVTVEEVLGKSDSLMVRQAVLQEGRAAGHSFLTKQMIYAMELVRQGMMALLNDDEESDLEDFNDDDSDLMEVYPRTRTSSDDPTSGSGRLTTPDVDEVPMQDAVQIEYLYEKDNRWVLEATKPMLLKHLQKIKKWYDEEVVEGSGDSLAHFLISEAFTEALDCLISPRLCEYFHRYNLQVMFCQEVGFLGQNNMDEVPSVMMCKLYAQFLQQLSPFYLRSLFTIPMSFAHPDPILVLIKNSRYLRKISISIMHCRSIFKCLRKHRKDIAEISAFAGGPFGDSGLTEGFMFPTFFRGRVMREVVFAITRKRTVRLTFRNLERFHLHFISESHNHFIHCFQYFYRNVKTQFFKIITDNFLTSATLKDKLSPPYFLEGKSALAWDSVYLMAGQFKFVENPNAFLAHEVLPQVKTLSVWQNSMDVSPKAALIREMVTRYGCSRLVLRMPYMYLDNELNIIFPYLSTIGEYLAELHVLSNKSAFHGSELITGLNSCPRLRVISLDVACFWPVTGMESIELRPLEEVVSLSITASILIDPEYNAIQENYKMAIFLRKVILKAPNLTNLELLRTPCDVAQNMTRNLAGKTRIKTLLIDFAAFKNNEETLLEVVENLSSLSYLLLYDISPEDYSRMKRCFYRTDLQTAYRSTKLIGAGDLPKS